jgi:ATP-binding cassette subfamily B protein
MSHAGAPVASWGTYRRLWVWLRPYTKGLILVLIVSLGATGLNLFQPYISKLLIDRALVPRDMHALVIIATLMLGVTLLGFLLNIASSYRYVQISAAMLFDMRLALFRHLQTLSPRFYASFRLGDLMSRLNNDVGEVQRVSADTLLSVLSNVMFLIGSIVIMLRLNWRLFLLGVILVPFCLYVFQHYQKRLTALSKLLRERSADLGSLFVDSILGMRVVVSLRAEKHEGERFRERNDALVRTMLDTQVASFLTGALPGSILTASTAAVFLYGGWMVIDNRMTIGTLVAFMAYHMRLLSPVQNLMGLTSGLASARVSLARIFELFDTSAEVIENKTPVPLTKLVNAIEIESVSIRHDRAQILDGVSLRIPAGGFLAILGPSGVGKSTLADLLVRYLDPDRGRILYDGTDLRNAALADLRREVILVDQSPYLFSATIAENIAFAAEGITRTQIEAAAQSAGLGEMIARLPQGYDTRTGERGAALSAGERQRIALARALLRRPSVLILDEPTSALDAETEKLVARNLRQALPNSTLIVITHRPALAEIADAIVTIENGKLSQWLAQIPSA